MESVLEIVTCAHTGIRNRPFLRHHFITRSYTSTIYGPIMMIYLVWIPCPVIDLVECRTNPIPIRSWAWDETGIRFHLRQKSQILNQTRTGKSFKGCSTAHSVPWHTWIGEMLHVQYAVWLIILKFSHLMCYHVNAIIAWSLLHRMYSSAFYNNEDNLEHVLSVIMIVSCHYKFQDECHLRSSCHEIEWIILHLSS